MLHRNAVPAVNVFVRDADAVSLMKRADRDGDRATPGQWSTPGGHPKYDDTRGELDPGEEASEVEFWTPEAMADAPTVTRDIDRERLGLVFE